jgi:hypothetical protein
MTACLLRHLDARQVTLDIHDDARGQNTLIDSTVRPLSSAGGAGSSGALQSQTFDNFKSSLGNSANRLARSVAKQGQPRIVAYCVGLLVVLMLVWRYIL